MKRSIFPIWTYDLHFFWVVTQAMEPSLGPSFSRSGPCIIQKGAVYPHADQQDPIAQMDFLFAFQMVSL